MKPKRKLRRWVKVTLLFFPIAVLIIQLFLVDLKLRKIIAIHETQNQVLVCEFNSHWMCCING